jgi:hypothetical protein
MPAFPDLINPIYTASGVPFEYMFEDYREQNTNEASNSTLKVRTPWVTADYFVRDILGVTFSATGIGMHGGSYFNRYLPAAHPHIWNLWCTDATLVKYPSSSKGGANQSNPFNKFFTTDWCIYQLTFTRLRYFVVDLAGISNPPIASTPKEAQRYVIPIFRPRAREFTVNSYQLVIEDDPTVFIKSPAFVMDREQDIFLSWIQIPADCVPWTAIDASLGTSNSADITLPIARSPDGIYTYRTFAQDTLLFRGLANELSQYQSASGYWFYDLPYYFTYRPNGWRKLPRPNGDGTFKTVIYKFISPTKYLYNQTAFANLFTPEP